MKLLATPLSMSGVTLVGTPSSSQGRLPGRKAIVPSSYRLNRSSTTFSPNLPTSGEDPCTTVLPLNPTSSGERSRPATASGVKTTGNLPVVTSASCFAMSSCPLTRATISDASSIGLHELSPSPTNSMSVPLTSVPLSPIENTVFS